MLKKILWAGCASFFLFSCKKDDSNTIELREYSEVAVENDKQLQEYLKTHFYTLNAPDAYNRKSVSFGEISGVNASKTPLLEQVQRKILKVRDKHGNYISHTMYYLILQEGSGQQATVADQSYLLYKGQMLNGTIFDQTTHSSMANWLDLLGTTTNSGTILGFREAVALLKSANDNALENPDGSISLPDNYGMGIFFLPAGVAYFSGSGSIPAYSPLIFEIGLVKTKRADHDGDGIPSIEEIVHNQDGTITYPDCNENLTPDYLDARSCK